MPDPVALWVEFTAPAFLPGGATWDGAIMVTIRGPGISKVDAPFPAYLVYSTIDSTAGRARVIVATQAFAWGKRPLFKVLLKSATPLASYSIALDQVIAASTHTARPDLKEYRIALTPILQ